MPLINYEVNLILTWSQNCDISFMWHQWYIPVKVAVAFAGHRENRAADTDRNNKPVILITVHYLSTV